MRFGRQDSLAEAIGVDEWPRYFNRSGEEIKPFSTRGFEGETRFINCGGTTAPEHLPELYESKEKCCGCTACSTVCPKGAILMMPDEEGFLYPVVDAAECIGCGACLRVCPLKGR